MKTRIKHIIFFLFIAFTLSANIDKETVESIQNQDLKISTAKNLHIESSTDALINSTIDLAHEEAWLFFDNVRPSRVVEKYGKHIKIFGANLEANVNAQVRIYKHGTVIMPHDNSFQPLEVFTDANFKGTSAKYSKNTFYRNLGDMHQKISSFKLKRGYMATLCNSTSGNGYSRVFIADDDDIEISQVQDEFRNCIASIRVMPWQWVTKKGWAGNNTKGGCLDKMEVTWYYDWGTYSKTSLDYEYVPERWGPFWPSFPDIENSVDVSHLIGFNEPDHEEQSNATVEKAIAEWPKMLATGLRVGAPATTDFNWLYKFMDQCKAKNYRVDFVVIHCYWANMSPERWYQELKKVHDRTGCAIWIKEWNNGANWTNEKWPTEWDQQLQKQYNDLKGILNVMDTAHFVERYSIYNWVEEKRAMILNNGDITPAGEFYRDNNSFMAFNRQNEVIPKWNNKYQPTLSTLNVKKNNTGVALSWNDLNGGLTTGYSISKKTEESDFNVIAEIDSRHILSYTDDSEITTPGYITYKVNSVWNDFLLESNLRDFYVTYNKELFHYGSLDVKNNEQITCKFIKTNNNPIVIPGVPTFRNSMAIPMTQTINYLDSISFTISLTPWSYLNNPKFNKSEELPFLSMPCGNFKLGSLDAESNLIENVTGSWKSVQFKNPFKDIPVVLAYQQTNRTQIPTTVRVRNITTEGFEVCIQKEAGASKVITREQLCYLAIMPGTGIFGDKKIEVGTTENVGNFYNSASVNFNETFVKPALFACMQTVNDEVVSTLRHNRLTASNANIFKVRESSVSNLMSEISQDCIGWIVLETDKETIINGVNKIDVDDNYCVYPSVVKDKLYVRANNGEELNVKIFNSFGIKVFENKIDSYIDMINYNKGFYMVQISDKTVYKIFKE